jgi:glycerol-3-phosphate dehydrogenase
MTRQTAKDISGEAFDVCIIGAGINGCGIARDASMRGLRVLLLDKGDISSGTTAWSTRLIHGGLRYLEHGELGLVRESLRERETLLRRVAPHLVRPLPVLVPLYAGRRRGALTIRTGLLAYDLLSMDKSLPRHRMLTTSEALARAPGLDASSLNGAALFYDAQVEYAERLALENALAARLHGATILTYARVERLLVVDGAARGVEFTDLLGGSTHEARASLVLNVAGPWVDEVLDGAGASGERLTGATGEKLSVAAGEKLIGGTKGSHIVVRPFRGAPHAAVYAEAVEDGRPFFVIPWDDKFLIGTTDERYEGDLNHIEADTREIEYLVRETNRALPPAQLTRDDVLYTYSGVRPLAYAGARAEAAVTRRHFVRPSRVLRGLFSVVGGKLTTYRSLAEEAVDLLFRQLGRTPPPCTTATTRLPGAAFDDFDALRERFNVQSPLPKVSNARLLKIYGGRATDVLRLALGDTELARPISDETGSIGAEVVYAFREELAETLVDCLMRRTMTGLNGEVGLDAVERAARLARKFLGWTDERALCEVENYRRYVERFQPKQSRER